MPKTETPSKTERDEKLARALRANLRRRKVAGRPPAKAPEDGEGS